MDFDKQKHNDKAPAAQAVDAREFVEAVALRYEAIDRGTDTTYCLHCTNFAHYVDGVGEVIEHKSDCIVLRAKERIAASPASTPEASQQAPVVRGVPLSILITDAEKTALCRFYECALDGEGYDVPDAMMRRLAEIGLLERKRGTHYITTEFGLYALGEYTLAASPMRATQQEGGK